MKNQEGFIETERLVAIHELIAGIIHELNDPLSAILGFSEILQSLDADPEVKKYIGNIHVAAVRSAKIVEGLLTFMRKREMEFHVININDVIRQTVSLFEYQMRTRDISLTLSLCGNELPVKGDAYKLQQVFFNILMNALQALELWQGEKRVSVSSELSGGTASITVSDSGPGIGAGDIGKVFTPFFTTKPKGTGLGLSIVHGVIMEHGGEISVIPNDGAGATGCSFSINLPVVPGAVPPDDERVSARQDMKRRVLIMDDDELVLHAMSRLMGIIGCEVVLATTGADGMKELRKGDFDIIFVDYKMSDMDGDDFIDKASEFMDTGKFVMITGDIHLNAEAIKKKYNIPVLWKPVGLKEFRKVLSAHA